MIRPHRIAIGAPGARRRPATGRGNDRARDLRRRHLAVRRRRCGPDRHCRAGDAGRRNRARARRRGAALVAVRRMSTCSGRRHDRDRPRRSRRSSGAARLPLVVCASAADRTGQCAGLCGAGPQSAAHVVLRGAGYRRDAGGLHPCDMAEGLYRQLLCRADPQQHRHEPSDHGADAAVFIPDRALSSSLQRPLA